MGRRCGGDRRDARHHVRLRGRQEPRLSRRRGRHGRDPHAGDLAGRLAGVGAPRGARRRCSSSSAGSAPVAAWWSRAATPAPSCSRHAEAKFFLTATEEERARRRVDELVAAGKPVDFDVTLREIRERDHARCEPRRRPDDRRRRTRSSSTAPRKPSNEVVDSLAAQVASRSRRAYRGRASDPRAPAGRVAKTVDPYAAVDNSGRGRYQLAPASRAASAVNPTRRFVGDLLAYGYCRTARRRRLRRAVGRELLARTASRRAKSSAAP